MNNTKKDAMKQAIKMVATGFGYMLVNWGTDGNALTVTDVDAVKVEA